MAQALVLKLPAQRSSLTLPHLFRQPLAFSSLAGTLAFWNHDGDWTLGLDPLDFSGTGYTARCRGELAFPTHGGPPVADVYAVLDNAEVPAAKLFWPLGSMSPAAVSWLDRALVAGRSTTPRWCCVAIWRSGRSVDTRAASRRTCRSAA